MPLSMLWSVISSTIKAILIVTLFSIFGIILDVAYNPLKPGEFVHEDIGLDIDQLLTKYGYPFENHTIKTEDGYILQLHRIPHGKSTNTINKKPLILMHGILGSSISYLATGPEKALPYILVENGYDVWLPNARGNRYSRKHETLNPDSDKATFYDFSWNEIGIYDLPASIDYILRATGVEKVYYAGLSQGSTAFFVMSSERPEYNDKVSVMIGLCPVAYTKHARGPAFVIPAMFPTFAKLLSDYYPEMLPLNQMWPQFAEKYCMEGSVLHRLCLLAFNSNMGYGQPKFNKTELSLYLSLLPSGSAVKQILHYSQILNSDIFRKYDHGDKNMEIYGQTSPPEYKFENMKVPTALFYGHNDIMVMSEDFEKLRKNLPNVVLTHRVDDEYFMHFDFLSSMNAVDVLFPYILELLNEY